MKLYNTLGRASQDFEPISSELVTLYTCGPTVYSYYHIGNLRNAVFNDTLRRTLETTGYKVKHVMNITDVGHLSSDSDEGEDKLESGAAAENKSVTEVANFYIEAFKKDMQDLNVLPPNGYPGAGGPYARATEFIEEQLEIVRLLIDKDYAYVAEEAIYFDVSKLPSYGELSGQKLSEKEVASRVEVIKDNQKQNPQDFALWFFTVGRFSNHTMHWESPWGEGFPGWHLECSAIIHATLGGPIDIHTGGVDHIGTHHPNEMAQTESAFGHKLANYWVHNEHLLVEGQKMSKSLGNAYTLADVKAKGFSPEALRLLYLQSHYRTQSNFSWESLEAAKNFMRTLHKWSDLQFQNFSSDKLRTNYQQSRDAIRGMLADDLNTVSALAYLSGMINRVEELGPDSESIGEATKQLDDLLGLRLSARQNISDEQVKLIAERQSARDSSDWPKSDEIRNQLSGQGIELDDTNYGPVWYRK